MPNWADDEGRYWWVPPGKMWYDSIQIPHPPISAEKGCTCEFCKYEKSQIKPKKNNKHGKISK